MAIAKTDVILLSRDDLLRSFDPQEAEQLRERARLNNPAFLSDEDVIRHTRRALQPVANALPYLLNPPSIPHEIGHELRPMANRAVLKFMFRALTEGSASAAPYIDPETKRFVCKITTVPDTITASETFTMLAYIPSYLTIRNVSHIRPSDIHSFVMFHEAIHCGQHTDIFRNLLSNMRSYLRIHREAEADEKGMDALRNHLRGQRTDAYIKDFEDFIMAARHIGALRQGADISMNGLAMPTHLPPPFRADEDHQSTEEPEFEYDASDMVLATLLISTASDVMAGILFNADNAPLFTAHDQPSPSGLAMTRPRLPSEPFSLELLIDAGHRINRDKPAIQLGIFHALRDIFSSLKPDVMKKPFEYRLWSLSDRMLENYINAVERYVPDLADNPLVAPARTLTHRTYEQAIKGLPAALSAADIRITTDTRSIDILDILKKLQAAGAFKMPPVPVASAVPAPR